MTFATIKTEVLGNIIDTPTFVSGNVGAYVNRAMKKLMQKHNFKVMEAEEAYTTTAGTRILGMRPSDWKQPRGRPYYIDAFGSPRQFHWVSEKSQAIFSTGDSTTFDTGSPRYLYEDDLPQELNVFPYPDGLSDYSDGEYRITVPYWKYLGELISDGDTNWFTDNAEQWLIFRATADAFYADHDEARAQLWESRAALEYRDVLVLDKTRRLAEVDTLVPHIGARMPQTQE